MLYFYLFQCDYESFLNEDIPTLEIRKLQEQNANLRAAVAQMRKEMERLDEQESAPPAAASQLSARGDGSRHAAPHHSGRRGGRSCDP